jgi:phosphoenolpyruvate carboxylase
MDGNPHVTAKSIRQTLARQRSLVLDLYYRECNELAGHLSQDTSRVTVSEELERRTQRYAGHFPEAASALPARHRQMAYRAFLRLISARIKATYDDHAFPYESADEFVADIELVADSLRANKGRNAGLFAVRRLLRRARTFGFHIATVDIRQNALVHRRVIGEGLQEPRWLLLDEDERTRRLETALERRESPLGALSSEGRRTLAVFQTIAHCRRKYGRDAIGPYIVSMAHGPDDVVGALPPWGNPSKDSVPPAETGESARERSWRTSCRGACGPGDHQRAIQSRWRCRARASAEAVMPPSHGGGTISRSGGGQHEAVLAAPRGAIAGHLRMTEQGENINTKYGLRGIALRSLEQTVSAVLLVTTRPPPALAAEAHWHSIMEEIASASRAAYQSLLSDPADFMEYFRAATPIDVIERIGTRSERADYVDETAAEPRAAPWIFAWTQSRCLLPGWYGVASGLRKAIELHGEDALVAMFEQWHFFRVLLSDVATALAKADLDIAALYSRLAGERHDKFFPAIRSEYRSCVDLILRLTRQNELLEASRTLRRAIRLRNPYVDPMSFLQVDLLERWRAGGRQDDAVLQALTASISGIAYAMQGTG